jgi:hypothetical protein
MSQSARILALAALAALLPACSTIDSHEKIAGWPELRIVEHFVPDAAMRTRCAKYVPFGLMPEACAEFYFDRGECHIWYSADFRPQPYVMEHERLHCEGFDHPGGSSLREALARYNAERRTAGPAVSGSGRAPRG